MHPLDHSASNAARGYAGFSHTPSKLQRALYRMQGNNSHPGFPFLRIRFEAGWSCEQFGESNTGIFLGQFV
jgi:hypothetical protein